MLKPQRALALGTLVLIVLLQIRLGYSKAVPEMPAGFVAVTGPHGITVLVGPLQATPTGGYVRKVIVPGKPPFVVSTEPGVTPQEIANTYG